MSKDASVDATPPEMLAFGVFGSSAAMRPVMRLVRQAASNGRGILLCGEAGTGRGRIARAIHALAGGRADTFVHCECGIAAGDHLEADLFGGVSRARRSAAPLESLTEDSLIWRARAGTLYLANIVEAPSPVQVRLARLMRDREATGPDQSPVPMDCRVIASTEPGFESAIDDGRLRRDLHARLALSIDVPPLRERKGDIAALAAFFLERYAQALGAAPKQLTAGAVLLLEALPWPGNGWELRGLLEALAARVPSDSIDLADVLASVRLDPGARSVALGGSLRAARRRFEREYIEAALLRYGGRAAEAARALGIQRTNMYRKIRSLRIRIPVNAGESRRSSAGRNGRS